MAVKYTALLTASDVDAEAESAFDFDISDDDTSTTVEAIIEETTSMLEGLLNRTLITRQFTNYFQYRDWENDVARDVYVIRPPHWPVVEIDTASFSAAASNDSYQGENNLITYASRFSGAVTYYAGYRRSEQVLADFTDGGAGQGSLSDLGTLPGELPYDIRNTAMNIVLNTLAVRRFGPGQRTRILNPAVQSTTIQEPILEYASRLVKERIPHHRRLA